MQDEPTVLVEVHKPKTGSGDSAHYLVVVDGPRQGRWIEVASSTVIGRGREADFDLRDPTVSGAIAGWPPKEIGC